MAALLPSLHAETHVCEDLHKVQIGLKIMKLDEEHYKALKIFQPKYLDEFLRVHEYGERFVHYTRAETAMQIISNSELWFRSAQTRNDYSEIAYGLSLIDGLLFGNQGIEFRDAVNDVFPNSIEQVLESYESWKIDWEH